MRIPNKVKCPFCGERYIKHLEIHLWECSKCEKTIADVDLDAAFKKHQKNVLNEFFVKRNFDFVFKASPVEQHTFCDFVEKNYDWATKYPTEFIHLFNNGSDLVSVAIFKFLAKNEDFMIEIYPRIIDRINEIL